MKLAFEPNLPYQQDAIQSVTDVFKGQPMDDTISEYHLESGGALHIVNGIRNTLVLSEQQILTNLQDIQARNAISPSVALNGMHFSIEMETGTGKTYVYLRTVYELNKQYGFKKFVIVVPSVAIREGVLKNLEITHEHLQTLYDNPSLHFHVYDSTKLSSLRGVATSNTIEVLVINIDSFAKDENVINKPNDRLSGQTPITFIQSVNPIVIVDEPQNMETDKRKHAIETLNPLCTLRYSATHKHHYNLIYNLNPVKAYDLDLVKQIEVDSVYEENANNNAFISLQAITPTKTTVTARVLIQVNEPNGIRKKSVVVRCGSDLHTLSNSRMHYKGYTVDYLDVSKQSITFANGTVLHKGETQGGLTDEVMKYQIQRTVEEHIQKERVLRPKGIKVLSLFFIDRVANYRQYTQDGTIQHGKFALWFEEAYKHCISKPEYRTLNLGMHPINNPVAAVHNGYFSKDKTTGILKDTTGETQADNDTYSLIMKDKEKLLGLDNPLRFIFSHSALREGWDNPNVFQICTLNETKSDMKKRQEIGRGLRLAVDESGMRVHDKQVNRLTVIANESYDDFAQTLQQEIEDDCGVIFNDRIKDRRKRVAIAYRKGFEVDQKFLEIWENIKRKTAYRVYYDTNMLIQQAANAIKDIHVVAPSIREVKVRLHITGEGIDTQHMAECVEQYHAHKWRIPDVLGYIQDKTELTRSTIYKILHESGKIGALLINPQLFLDVSSQKIKDTLRALMIDGIKYQKIGDAEYEMKLFESQELEAYIDDKTFEVQQPSKTIYETYIPLDSDIENQFAKDCETSEQVQFYFKLPSWFKIPTPIGNYNPDWAVVFQDNKLIYFVVETKDTGTDSVDESKLRVSERLKIECGRAHFAEHKNVTYKVANKVAVWQSSGMRKACPIPHYPPNICTPSFIHA